MSWLAQLHKTYEQGLTIDQSAVPFEERLMPVSHTLQNAHIHIVIDEQGNFKRAAVLEKTQIVLPATEQSAGRSGTKAPPHPLADKIQYVAKDYSDYGGLKKSFFEEYEQLLARWCESPFSHPKVCAVHAYITKGQVVADLIAHHILHVDEQGKLLEEWPADDLDEKKTEPLIFKVLPKTKGKTEQGNALVCWSVENQGDADSKTWEDQSLQQSWADFDGMTEGAKGLCFILGQEEKLTASHPAKLRHTGDKAKLISANDMSGFTFRGRFTDTSNSIKSGGSQAVGISLEVTQKAHNALRWLIARQGYRNADQVYVSWAVSGKKIPKPLTDTWTMLATAEITKQPEDEQEEEHQVDHTVDIGEGFAHRLNKYIAGYRQELEASEQIVVMGLDSATPGRMGIIYYRELLASEFLDRLHAWHEQFAWPQRHTQEFPDPKGKKKPIRKTIWPKSCPVPRIIAEAAYGDILKSNDTLKKSVLERILPCIVDGRPFPKDIMLSAVRRAGNRNNCEHWEWERNLGVACALFKGYYERHTTQHKRRNYKMALEKDRTERDYLYGRLLAVAEKIEEVALYVGGESRPTSAARLMQRFADRPFSTWLTIEKSLQPYMQRLQGNRAGFLTNRKKELDEIHAAFTTDDFTSDKSLTGEFLLGYHCQRMELRKKVEKEPAENNSKE